MGMFMNQARGTVVLCITGKFPERFLNLCAQHRIAYWGLSWVGEHTIRLTTFAQNRRRMEPLAERIDCTIQVEDSKGLPEFLSHFRRRYAFLIGLACSLLAVCVLSSFILTIEVTGNSTVPTSEILWELRRQGVRIGVYGPSLDRKVIAQQALVHLDTLSWMSINLYGTRLEVVVREAVEPPELLEDEGFFDIVAEADGIITQIEPLQGEAVVQEGDTVAQGDMLISGTITMEPPLYSDLPIRTYQTHARGRVYARTWRTVTAVIPTEASIKVYTGEKHSNWSLSLLGFHMDFFQKSSIFPSGYDKITKSYPLTLPDGTTLPVMLVAEQFHAYQLETVSIQVDEAQNLLEERLLEQLQKTIGSEGQILSTDYRSRVWNGLLEVTLTAECREEIGKETVGTPIESNPLQQGE